MNTNNVNIEPWFLYFDRFLRLKISINLTTNSLLNVYKNGTKTLEKSNG